MYGFSECSDEDRKRRLASKFVNHDNILSYALSKLHYESYTRFRNKIIKNFGKTKKELHKEFMDLKYDNT